MIWRGYGCLYRPSPLLLSKKRELCIQIDVRELQITEKTFTDEQTKADLKKHFYDLYEPMKRAYSRCGITKHFTKISEAFADGRVHAKE